MSCSTRVSSLVESKGRSNIGSFFLASALLFCVYFIAGSLVENDYKQRIHKWQMQFIGTVAYTKPAGHTACQHRCKPLGSESLPEGIVVKTSNLEMRPLWGSPVQNEKLKWSKSLLAIAVGIRQKDVVKKIVNKFLSCSFVVMLFHYDGIVDEWKEMEWHDRVIHLSANNQTKWWFAKRFMHPDIIAEYDYVFLWDEDLDVGNFNPLGYIDIVKHEGFEISQPALDPSKSVVHHQITTRLKKSTAHRKMYKSKGREKCDDNSTAPPCIGWVEMMAPVFSKAAWRCVWYMIQNDLIHAWGLDIQLGYCAQGDRTKNIGIVDSEYIVHLGLPTLGALDTNKVPSRSHSLDNRAAVRRQSFVEMQAFKRRWEDAIQKDKCWIDMYKPIQPTSQ